MDPIPQLIHSDQVGFVPKREARDNTTKAIHLIQAAQTRKKPLLLLSTDAEKAFNRVSWPFLVETLHCVGLCRPVPKYLRPAIRRSPKIAAFADDLLFFLTKPLVSIPNLLLELRIYEELSFFRISYQKSEALDVSLLTALAALLRVDFAFKWALSIKYLGILLP